jgi:outer membrane immunogenic protein
LKKARRQNLPKILEQHKKGKLNCVAIALGIVASTSTIPAFAADSLAPDGHDWTGLYFGVYGGIAASDGLLDDAWCRNNINTPDPDNCSSDDGDTDTPELYGAPVDGNAITFGGLIGYNHQFNSGVVFGVESDLGFGGRGTGSFESSVNGVSSFEKGEIDIGLAGSTRLRAGYALNQWLPYITAGVAYAQYKADLRREDPNENRQGDGSFVGWTAGAGLNYAVSSNVIFGLEYRYTDYGSDTHLLYSGADTDTRSSDASLTQHEIRASVAYAMGAPADEGGSQDASDWSGIYTGIFAGHAFLDGIDDNSFCRLNAVFGECGGGTYGAPVDGNALTLGGLIGYSHRFDSGMVFGVEGDVGLGGSAEGNFVHGLDGVNPDHSAKVDVVFNGSTRLRAGYAVGDWLPFVTAGVAYAKYNVTTSNPTFVSDNRFGDGNLFGWTVGTGLNYAIANGVILGLEYRYTDYGSDTHLYYADTDGDLWSQDLELTQHEVRATVAYDF